MGIGKRRLLRKVKHRPAVSTSRNVEKNKTDMVGEASLSIDIDIGIFNCKSMHTEESFRSSISKLASTYGYDEAPFGKCAVCGASSKSCCGTCNSVFYCGKEHQKEHWNNGHRKSCSRVVPSLPSIKEEVKPILCSGNPLGCGPFLVASKNFKPMDIVFEESPLVSGPGISGRGGYEPLCLGCTEPVSSEQKCSSCQWPLCGRQCENNLHSKYECDIFTKNLVKELKDPFQYELLRILRCLLTRERDPPMFEELMKLETASEHRILLESQSKAVETALIFINQNCKLLEYDIELIDRMCGVVELHSQVTGMYRTTMGIYSFTSKLMYACAANTRLVEVKGSNKFDSKFRIIVVKPINKGEHLTFNLMETLVPGYIRTRFLKEYYYECDCELCADPTEKGTYFSAIKCASCNQFSKEPGDKPKVIENGYLISDTVQDLSSNWKCMNCDNFADGESILRLLDQIDDEYQLFRRQLPSKSLDENLCQLTSKIRMYHDNFHPNHFFNWRLNYLYMTLLVDYVHSLKYPDTWESLRHVFDQIEEIIHPLISTLLTLKPGATLAKGKILYDAVRALWCFIQWAVIFGNAQSFDKHQDAKYFYALAAETIGILQFEITATDQKLISQIYYMKNNKTNIFERLKHHSVIAERKEIPST